MFSFYIVHTIFDFLAVALAVLSGLLVCRWRLSKNLEKTAASIGPAYFIALSLGSVTGAYLFGTVNLYLSGIHEVGRSILGALAGAICTVEIYKLIQGTKSSTGYIYAIPFCVNVAVGRIGCLLSGLDDNTHGIPTHQSWGWDYGDHVLRYPVQLFESASMLVCGLGMAWLLKDRSQIVVRYGFYICVGFYAIQRFVWEFFKPYGPAFGPFNTFQLLCVGLMVYSISMIIRFQRQKEMA